MILRVGGDGGLTARRRGACILKRYQRRGWYCGTAVLRVYGVGPTLTAAIGVNQVERLLQRMHIFGLCVLVGAGWGRRWR